MLEKINSKDVYVQNYTSGFDIKEYIQDVLLPKYFPNIPMNKLNLGFTGLVSEFISDSLEGSTSSSVLAFNESFITKATRPGSIYSYASAYDKGYSFAVPSTAQIVLQIALQDIIDYSTKVKNTNTKRFVLDRDTKVILNQNTYKFEYDIYIDHQMIGGQRAFKVYYNTEEASSMFDIKNKYIKHQASDQWLVLIVSMRQFDRKIITNSITNNLSGTNTDIKLRWTNQLAGLDLIYIDPTGQRTPMKVKPIYSKPVAGPFLWYQFEDENIITLSFCGNPGYWKPAFNSKVEAILYTCEGKAANFDNYNNRDGLQVQKVGTRYSYNSKTSITALCYGGSVGGLDIGNIEHLRNDVILAMNSANALTTDRDINLWFNNYAKRNNNKSIFFKRRDDPSGQLYSQFIAIKDGSYTYPTNTLNIKVEHDQFDYINSDPTGLEEEFIIKPGHLWEYNDIIDPNTNEVIVNRNEVRMVKGINGMAMISDEAIPSLSEERPFMFVNPFAIKIYRDPMVSANYNNLINSTSWPEEIALNSDSFYQFQLATFSIKRTLSSKYNDKYHLEIICVPRVTDNPIRYIEGIGSLKPKEENNLRLVLILKNKLDGEAGYIEMIPIEERKSGAVVFACDISIHDNIHSDMTIEVDQENTLNVVPLLTTGHHANRIFLDAEETSFEFAVMIKDPNIKTTTRLFDNESFTGYTMANKFMNSARDLNLYKPLNMMRSTIGFEGENGSYTITASMIPFLKYDVALNDEKMLFFIQAFNNQYVAMEPIISKLEGNSFLDFKLYNTYGRSNNYYIGPMEGYDNLYDSDILLDNVYVRIKFKMAVYDRSLYTQTQADVINEISNYLDKINESESSDIHISNLIKVIEQNNPNVNYLRFLGFDDYDSNKQSIFVKYDSISELRQDQLISYIPEIIRADADTIEIYEEI